MNTGMARFNTAVRQMTEMFQWPKCLSKKNSWQFVPFWKDSNYWTVL